MRKTSQSWFVPLLILFAVLWAMGKKDTPPAPVQPHALSTPHTLASISPASPPAPAPAHITEHFVSADNLNVRDQPGGKVISKLRRGKRFRSSRRGMNGRVSALMVNLRNGFRPRVYAVGLAATLFRSPDRRPSLHSLQLTVPRAPVPQETCVSGLGVVDTALPLVVTNGTAFERLSDDVLPGITLSLAL